MGALIGSWLAGDDFVETVSPDHSLFAIHRSIISAMQEIHPADLGVLITRCDKDRVLDLMRNTEGVDVANLYRIIKDHYINRELQVQYQASQSSHGLDRLAYMQTECDRIEASISEGGTDTAAENFEKSVTGQGKMFKTHIPDLDKALGGVEQSEKIVIGAMRSGGKTSLATCLALNINRYEHASVGIYSMESPDWQIMRRLLANAHNITIDNIKHRRLSDAQRDSLVNGAYQITRDGIAIYECSGQTAEQVARQMLVSPHDVVIVDHMQKFRGESLRQAVGDASNLFASVADRKGKIVIMCSQINRTPEQENREPRLSDLKEAGEIEQDADTVILVHTDPETKEQDLVDCKLIIAKRRDGGVGYCPIKWNKAIARFYSEANEEPTF